MHTYSESHILVRVFIDVEFFDSLSVECAPICFNLYLYLHNPFWHRNVQENDFTNAHIFLLVTISHYFR